MVSVDTSSDLLAYVNALLKRSGYEVFTTRNLSDARTLMKATKPSVVICGPGMRANELAIEMFRRIDPRMRLLLLQADFSTVEAS
jgi:DNA-binding NtrC family response regulator